MNKRKGGPSTVELTVGIVLLLIMALAAHAKDREVRVLYSAEATLHTGDEIPFSRVQIILFVHEPCTLPIWGAEHMFRAWEYGPANQVGCWYSNVDYGVVYINKSGQLLRGPAWPTYPLALLHDDGLITITEHNYNSDTFLAEQTNKIVKELLAAQHNENPQ